MKEDLRCPICEEGNLSEEVSKDKVDYKGETAELDLHFSVCDSCGSEQVNVQQSRMNKRYMVAFKKKVDGLLTGSEVKSVREKLGLTQSDAAKIFGGGPVAFSKYESDDVTQSEAMDRLLRVAEEVPGVFDYLAKRSQIQIGINTTYYTEGFSARRILSSGYFIYGRHVETIYEYDNSLMDYSETCKDETLFEQLETISLKKVVSSDRYKSLQ